MKTFAIAAVLAASSFVSAQAASISGLVNTGSFASGSQDTNYSLSMAGVSGTTYGYVSKDNAWPINPWLANTTNSKWITPTSDQAQSLDPVSNGTYTWTLNFNLTGYNASTASFSGQFAADNAAIVKLNGVTIGTSTGFTSYSSFAANSGFNAGANTLEFVLTNYAQSSGNPAGLRVEFLQSNVAAVPEPETYAMLLAGLGLIGAIARRRTQRKT